MKWAKPSPELVEIFDALVPAGGGIEKRKMFGFPCAFLNHHMFMGLHHSGIFIRLSEKDRELFLKLEGAERFEPMPGRVMREYVVVPPWLLEDSAHMEEWIQTSLAYVSRLPPKTQKK